MFYKKIRRAIDEIKNKVSLISRDLKSEIKELKASNKNQNEWITILRKDVNVLKEQLHQIKNPPLKRGTKVMFGEVECTVSHYCLTYDTRGLYYYKYELIDCKNNRVYRDVHEESIQVLKKK